MNQAPLQLDTPATATASAPVDRTGFDIGWDHAHHGLVPPAELLQHGKPLCQGWTAGRAVFGRRTLSSSRYTRLWLQLRLHAWQQGIAFDTLQITPNHLAQIDTPLCPVRRCPLGGAPGQPDAAVVERLNPQAGYAAGNLAVMSLEAARARAGVDVTQALRRARSADVSRESVLGLDAAAWWRLAALRAFATPLAFAEATRLPLAVLPPNRARLLNAAQGLQALVTRFFAAPGWSTRCRALAQMLPQHTLRHDFNFFVGAMAPRVLEAGHEPVSLRRALEDAWLHKRVQRRWQHLVLSLGETATEALLERAAQAGLAGVRVVCHVPAQATEGWGLPDAAQPQRSRGMVLVMGAATETGKSCKPSAKDTPLFSPAAPRAARAETATVPAAPATHA